MTPHILLTRPASETERSLQLYQHLGLPVHSVPLVELASCPLDPERLRSLLDQPFDALLLTSGTAAERWFDCRLSVARCRWLVVGERAAAVIRRNNLDGEILTVQPSGAALLEWVDRMTDGRPRRVIYPCSADRTNALVDGLRRRGVDVEEVHLYRPELPAHAPDQLRATLDEVAGSPVVFMFHSPSAVLNFFRCNWEAPAGAIFAAIGPTTAAPLRERGLDPLVPAQPTDTDLAEAIAHRLNISPLDPTA